jgi:pimeloyl-ACP methyl ester carboxylesterase
VRRDFRQAEAETTGSVDEKNDLQGPLVIIAIAAVTSWRRRQQTLRLVKSNARSADSRPRCQQTDTHDLDLKPGLKVQDQGYPVKGGEVTMQTLVMIPGLGSDAAVWKRTITALNSEVNCLVGDTLSDRSLRGMAQRILDQAPETFSLAGVSMGGMVALEMMKIAPERVTRLALIDTNARADAIARKAYRYLANLVAITGDFERLSERSVKSLVHPSTPNDVRAELAEMGARVGVKTYIRQNGAVAARKDLRPVLQGIAVPTAVVVGSEDRLTPVELSQEIHNLTPGSTLHVIPGCGHLPPIEKPTVLAAILLGLMK